MRRRRCVRPPHAATRKQKSNVQMITQARFVTFRQAATAAGHPRPPNFRRHFFITVLRPYDTAIHSESKKFIDDLGELGKSLGSDLVRSHDVLANFGLARTTGPLDPSLAQWLASSVPETHDLLGKTISRLLKKRRFRLLCANRGRAVPRLAASFPAPLQAHDQQRHPPLSDSVLTAIAQLSPTTPQLVASLQRTIEQILEFRDGLLSLIYETKNGQNVKLKCDGAKIKEFIAEEGLKEYMVGAHLLIRRMLGAQLLPVSSTMLHLWMNSCNLILTIRCGDVEPATRSVSFRRCGTRCHPRPLCRSVRRRGTAR
jgi:hypothetical protein